MQSIKKISIGLTSVAVLLAMTPYVAIWVDKSFTHVGIGILLLGWFVLYPIYFLITGILLGKYNITKRIGALPVCYAIVCFITNMSITGFDIWVYYVGYLLIAYSAMGVRRFIQRSKEDAQREKRAKQVVALGIILLVLVIGVALLPMVVLVLNMITPSYVTTGVTVVTQEVEGTSIQTLRDNRTAYLGDHTAVSNLIGELLFPGTVKYESFALQTDEKPYALTVYFTTDSDTLAFYKEDVAWKAFYENQILLFALIGNVDLIHFNLSDGDSFIEMSYPRTIAEDTYGDLFKRSETLEAFYTLQDELFNN